ncbi:MAG: hypothetical protein WBF17_23115, partial [Phycisphaerae bacterium]
MARRTEEPGTRRDRLARTALLAAALALSVAVRPCQAKRPGKPRPGERIAPREFVSLRRAIGDLMETFGRRYPDGAKFLARLDALERAKGQPAAQRDREFRQFRSEALLANPLLDFGKLLLVKRAVRNSADWKQLGMPSNHECNSSLRRTGYDNEIA